ncbi:MAG: sulfatase [Verrucomicrobiales bacterium]|nr:sulfatase [Verrucomicrobiales bacterium]
MKSLVLLFFAVFAISFSHAKSPNFVVIFCDDLGYGDLSCFGNPSIKTPNLDRMASEGQKWTQFYVADPVCTPSRAGLLTGRYPIRNGMSSAKRVVLFPDSANGLAPSEITIAEVLKQKDYATAAVGKWHLGHLPPYLPINQGFDSYFGIPYSNDMDRIKGADNYRKMADDPNWYPNTQQYNVPLMDGAKIIEQPADQNTITKRYTEKAVEYIGNNKDKPFFLYLAHSLPHIPLFCHPDFRGKSMGSLYGDVIEEIDWSVGQVLEAVQKAGIADNTVVVFSSDNGPWLSFKTHGGSAGPLRAGKGTTFEGGQRVPTIFWGPGIVKPGMVTEMGSTMDLMNTFATLAGAEIPSDRKMDSYDLSPVLTGTGKSPRSEFHYWTRAELHAIRSGKWKLHIKQREMVNYGRQVEMDKPELYDLVADISEAHDVAKTHPEVVAEMQKKIEAHLADTADGDADQLEARIPAN